MCGRFTRDRTWEDVWAFHQPWRRLRVEDDADALQPAYNVAPSQPSAVVRLDPEDDAAAIASVMRWGLVPRWSAEPSTKLTTFNARSERAATSQLFAAPLSDGRCVVPVSGFYEWRTEADGSKTPHYIFRADGDCLLLAGLFDVWRSGNAVLRSFTILTTAANDQLAGLHDRMPCVLERESVASWLEAGAQRAGTLLAPAADGVLAMHAVRALPRAGGRADRSLTEPAPDADGPRTLFG